MNSLVKLNGFTESSVLQDLTTQDVRTAQKFKDEKRHLWLLGILIPNIGHMAFLGYQFGPKLTKPIFACMGPLAIHGIIPLIDKLLGEDPSNPPEEMVSVLEQDPYYARLVKLFIPFQLSANVHGLYIASRKETSWFDRILLGHMLGMINGVAINTAHELCHKSNKRDHYLAHLCLAPSGYSHFRIEHPYGHHRRVATPEDPASAKLGESYWQFLPRSAVGGICSAIDIETRRLKRKGAEFWSLDNELFHGWAMSAAYHAAMLKLFGKRIALTQAVQSLCAIGLFEVVNYMEHYGLKRAKLENGNYVRTQPEHSWNNNSLFSNVLLYQLQRHSDHHAYPTRSFQSLRHYEDVPQLPKGYASMILPALIPRWWYGIMDKRVIAHYHGDLSKMNVMPNLSNALKRKYASVFKSAAQLSESR